MLNLLRFSTFQQFKEQFFLKCIYEVSVRIFISRMWNLSLISSVFIFIQSATKSTSFFSSFEQEEI